MKKILFFIFITLATLNTNGQTANDTIALKLKLTGYKFYYQGQQIKANEVFVLINDNDLAYEDFNASREAYIFGSVFAIIGTGLIMYPFIDKWAGNEPNYGASVAGACFVGISVPIFRGYHKKTVSAIKYYNHPLPALPATNDLQGLYFGTSSSGMALSYRF